MINLATSDVNIRWIDPRSKSWSKRSYFSQSDIWNTTGPVLPLTKAIEENKMVWSCANLRWQILLVGLGSLIFLSWWVKPTRYFNKVAQTRGGGQKPSSLRHCIPWEKIPGLLLAWTIFKKIFIISSFNRQIKVIPNTHSTIFLKSVLHKTYF